MSDKKKLIIVDVSNFIFRAFFAIRPLNAPDGTPVNAVYGIFTMLLKLFSEHRPTHIFLARDTKGGSFRNRLYSEYKANRSEPPEALVPQFALIEKLFQRMNLPTFSHEEFEADDIIGSAVTQWKNDFDEIYIASGDKDLMQFVGDHIYLLDTMKDKLYSANDVVEKMGVRPEQIVDFLSIVGDSSDNIPGMKGIGSVGAQNLLKEYGTLDAIIENISQLKGKKIIEAFTHHLEDAYLSRSLVKIVTTINLGHLPEETRVHFYPTHELSDYLKELGFKSALAKLEEMRFQFHMAKEVDASVAKGTTPLAEEDLGSMPLFQSAEKSNFNVLEIDYSLLIEKLKNEEVVALKIDYDSEDIIERKVKSIYLALINLDDVYLFKGDVAFLFLKEFLGLRHLEVCGDQIKKDFVFFMVNELPLYEKFFDVGLAHFNINTTEKHDLESMIVNQLNLSFPMDEEKKDAFSTKAILALTSLFKEKLKKLECESIYEQVDLKIVQVLARMEKEGISLNPNYLIELSHELEKELKNIEERIKSISGEEINLNSPKQVGILLFEKLNMPVIKKTKTGYSTDAEVLEELEALNLNDVPTLLLTHREYGKILNTYVKALPLLIHSKTKRIHTHFNLTIAQTGRLSSTNPNLQNIPIRSQMGQRVRKAFMARPGLILLSADYSQVELRLLAHFSEDPTMLKSFQENVDIHAQTACEVLGRPIDKITSNDRSMAKTVNFGLMYGQGSFGLAQTLKISRTDAKNYIDKYFAKFSHVKKFLDTLKEKAEQTGMAETYHGRKRLLPDIYSQNRTIKAQAERMAINSPIQGTAADIIKLAMISIDQKMQTRGLKSKMLLQVHDELIFEVREEELQVMKELVTFEMQNVVALKVPLLVSLGVGVNWYDLK